MSLSHLSAKLISRTSYKPGLNRTIIVVRWASLGSSPHPAESVFFSSQLISRSVCEFSSHSKCTTRSPPIQQKSGRVVDDWHPPRCWLSKIDGGGSRLRMRSHMMSCCFGGLSAVHFAHIPVVRCFPLINVVAQMLQNLLDLRACSSVTQSVQTCLILPCLQI